MGMFDYYRPKPEIVCPDCRKPLQSWQGKHGPCGLWVFVQNEPELLNRTKPNSWDHARLPEKFVFTDECCRWIFLGTGRCENGIWVETTVRMRPKDSTGPLEILSAKLGPPPA